MKNTFGLKKNILNLIVFLIVSKASLGQDKETVNIYFDFDRYAITASNSLRLDSLAKALNLMPVAFIRVNGHTDSKGSDAYNDDLSLKRAQAIKSYLQAKKLSQTVTFIDKGFGKRQLINAENTTEAQALNRRVDIIISLKPEEIIVETAPPAKTITAFIEDSATKTGHTLSLPNMQFEPGKAILLPGSQPLLTEILSALNGNPKVKISIEGHICCRREEDDELFVYSKKRLSEERAKTIYQYLLSNGIEEGRLSFKGFGSTQPLFPLPEKNEPERIANRRVEIRITDK